MKLSSGRKKRNQYKRRRGSIVPSGFLELSGQLQATQYPDRFSPLNRLMMSFCVHQYLKLYGVFLVSYVGSAALLRCLFVEMDHHNDLFSAKQHASCSASQVDTV